MWLDNDHIIDLGPEGGVGVVRCTLVHQGGYLTSYTGQYLKEVAPK